jgi:DNA invertase Pin-like site-specific DNA recombinase
MPVIESAHQKGVAGSRALLRAAQYVRMSTDQQKYSIENQQLFIATYAKAHGIEIVRTYNDYGYSGVTLKGRDALRQLIADVQRGQAIFDQILVYDVSRWGRFQNIDESAHYEYLCRKAGVAVHYCAEEFENDGSMVATLLKGMKRAMAGEYSREQSAKVSQAKRRQAGMGFHVGGPAPLGFRRVLVDRNGKQKSTLAAGTRKCLQEDRVMLQPGPRGQIQTVRDIFRLFVVERLAMQSIAEALNGQRRFNVRGNPWNGGGIARILRNEKYIGTATYNRTLARLTDARIAVPRRQWTVVKCAFKPIIDEATFYEAQRIIGKGVFCSDNDLLDRLTSIWCAAGHLSWQIVQSASGPAVLTYVERFGGIGNAFKRIGYRPTHHYRFAGGGVLNSVSRVLIDRLVSGTQTSGNRVSVDAKKQVFTIDGGHSVTLSVLPYSARAGAFGWWLYSRHVVRSEHLLLARMNRENSGILDLHLLPFPALSRVLFRITDEYLAQLADFRLLSPADLVVAIRRLSPTSPPA